MILAPSSLSSRYHAAHPLFALAFDWLGRQAGAAFSPGRREIRGEDLYASFDEGMTRPAESGRFEAHRRYVDIQVCLEGGELIDWTPVDGLEIEQGFAQGGDVAFFKPPAAGSSRLLLRPGFFAVFFPEDAHRPLGAIGAAAPYRKCVIKVALDAR